MKACSGRDAIAHLLRPVNVERNLASCVAFRGWIQSKVESWWEHDPVFRQKRLVRNLTLEYSGELAAISYRLEKARKELDTSPQKEAITSLTRRLSSQQAAADGLAKFIADNAAEDDATSPTSAPPSKVASARSKLKEVRDTIPLLEKELRDTRLSVPQIQEVEEACAHLERFRQEIGLEEAVSTLKVMERALGQTLAKAGGSFEEASEGIVVHHILPKLRSHTAGCRTFLEVGSTPCVTSEQSLPISTRHCEELVVLRNVTLGMAAGEMDYVVVKCLDAGKLGKFKEELASGRLVGGHPQPRRRELAKYEPYAVEVLAVVEVKRNANDIAKSYEVHARNLAWLNGETREYDPVEFRTMQYASGHFDRAFVHTDAATGAIYVFSKASFSEFRGAAMLRRMHFITRDGKLTGMSSGTVRWLSHMLATSLQLAGIAEPETAGFKGVEVSEDDIAEALERLYGEACQRTRIDTESVLLKYMNDEESAANIHIVHSGPA